MIGGCFVCVDCLLCVCRFLWCVCCSFEFVVVCVLFRVLLFVTRVFYLFDVEMCLCVGFVDFLCLCLCFLLLLFCV